MTNKFSKEFPEFSELGLKRLLDGELKAPICIYTGVIMPGKKKDEYPKFVWCVDVQKHCRSVQRITEAIERFKHLAPIMVDKILKELNL